LATQKDEQAGPADRRSITPAKTKKETKKKREAPRVQENPYMNIAGKVR